MLKKNLKIILINIKNIINWSFARNRFSNGNDLSFVSQLTNQLKPVSCSGEESGASTNIGTSYRYLIHRQVARIGTVIKNIRSIKKKKKKHRTGNASYVVYVRESAETRFAAKAPSTDRPTISHTRLLAKKDHLSKGRCEWSRGIENENKKTYWNDDYEN